MPEPILLLQSLVGVGDVETATTLVTELISQVTNAI